MDIFIGSPRYLISPQGSNQKVTPSGSIMIFEFKDFPKLLNLAKLIPDNAFCGTADIVPGLENDRIPRPFLKMPPPRGG